MANISKVAQYYKFESYVVVTSTAGRAGEAHELEFLLPTVIPLLAHKYK
jgi:hypothetical protein